MCECINVKLDCTLNSRRYQLFDNILYKIVYHGTNSGLSKFCYAITVQRHYSRYSTTLGAMDFEVGVDSVIVSYLKRFKVDGLSHDS